MFFSNSLSFNDFFYERLYKNIKFKISIKKEEKKIQNLLKFTLYFIGIVLIFLLFQNIIKKRNYSQNIDIYFYVHDALDGIRNGYFPNFFGSVISTKLFTYMIIPFLSLDPQNWYLIVSIYLSGLQFFLLLIIIYTIFIRLNRNLVFIIFPLYLAGIYLGSWFTFVLPSNWNILLFLMIIQFSFEKSINSWFLSIMILIFALLLHVFSTIMIFGVPFIINLVFITIKTFFIRHKISHLKREITKNKEIIFFVFLIGSITLFYLLFTNFQIFKDLFYHYEHYSVNRSSSNLDLYTWNWHSIGVIPIILIYIFFLTGFFLGYKKGIKHNITFYLFFSLYLTLYLSNTAFWIQYIHSVYVPYRFFIYHNLSFILLVPCVLYFWTDVNVSSVLKKYYHQLLKKSKFNRYLFQLRRLLKNKFQNSSYSLKLNFREKLKKKKINMKISLLFILTLSLIPQINFNITHDFVLYQYEHYLPVGYVKTLEWLSKNTLENDTYLYNSKNILPRANWDLFHTYMGDTRCIDFSESNPYLYDTKYALNNSDYLLNYEIFKDYIYNTTKSIYEYPTIYDNLSEDKRTTQKLDYLILDSLTNPNLIHLLRLDNISFSILSDRIDEHWYEQYRTLIFYPGEFGKDWRIGQSTKGWGWIYGNLTIESDYIGYQNVLNYSTTSPQFSSYGGNWNLTSLEWSLKILAPDMNIIRSFQGRSNSGSVWKVNLETTGEICFYNITGEYHTGEYYETNQFLEFKVKWTKNFTQELFFNNRKIGEIEASDLNVDFFRIVNGGLGKTYFILDN